MNRIADRLIAAFAALAIFFAAQGTVRLERDVSGQAVRAFSAIASFTALHAAPTQRLASDSRSSTRWPSSSDVPMPAQSSAASPSPVEHRVDIAESIGQVGEPATARGYDATAPPALS